MNGEATYTIFLQIKSEWPTSRDAIATTVSGSQLINIQCRGRHLVNQTHDNDLSQTIFWGA